MALEEISIGAREGLNNAKRFNLEANIVGWFFLRNLPKVKIPNLNKISIRLTENKNGLSFIPNNKVIRVCLYEQYFDFDSFFKEDQFKRRRIILDTIIAALKEISQKLSWDITPFEETYKKLTSSNLEIKYPLIKVTSSKNKKNKAYIEIEFFAEYAIISLIVLNINNDLLKKIEVIKIQPNQMFVYRAVGLGKWINDNEYIISNPTKAINFKIDIPTGEVKLIFNTSSYSEKELIEELKILSADGSDDEKLELIKKRLAGLISNDKGLN